MTAVFKDDAELLSSFVIMKGFRRWLTETVFGLTYDRPEAGRFKSL